jgi:hypothetical protein
MVIFVLTVPSFWRRVEVMDLRVLARGSLSGQGGSPLPVLLLCMLMLCFLILPLV